MDRVAAACVARAAGLVVACVDPAVVAGTAKALARVGRAQVVARAAKVAHAKVAHAAARAVPAARAEACVARAGTAAGRAPSRASAEHPPPSAALERIGPHVPNAPSPVLPATRVPVTTSDNSARSVRNNAAIAATRTAKARRRIRATTRERAPPALATRDLPIRQSESRDLLNAALASVGPASGAQEVPANVAPVHAAPASDASADLATGVLATGVQAIGVLAIGVLATGVQEIVAPAPASVALGIVGQLTAVRAAARTTVAWGGLANAVPATAASATIATSATTVAAVV